MSIQFLGSPGEMSDAGTVIATLGATESILLVATVVVLLLMIS